MRRAELRPVLLLGTLENPDYLKTVPGGLLLIGGWWRHTRKIHYAADLLMALSWGLICGFDHSLPYFFLFLVMILQRLIGTSPAVGGCTARIGTDTAGRCPTC